MTNTLARWTRSIATWQLAAAAVLLGLILATMVAQVVARYLFQAPFSWSEECVRLGLVWMTFLASAGLMGQRRHLAVDLWSSNLPPQWRRRADAMVDLFVAVACLTLLVGSLNFVWRVHPVGSPALGIPKSIWYGSVSVGLLMMASHGLINGWCQWQGVDMGEGGASSLDSDEALSLSLSESPSAPGDSR